MPAPRPRLLPAEPPLLPPDSSARDAPGKAKSVWGGMWWRLGTALLGLGVLALLVLIDAVVPEQNALRPDGVGLCLVVVGAGMVLLVEHLREISRRLSDHARGEPLRLRP
ncbi:hypothetical protein [Marinactinospora rubrisoli]|uniref:DUF202 domain-containing protein n=1 Tax=Marinactinospora rubrisoli TaxID=2715399 RepID=A0ABW2KMY9_9ACTN